MPAPLIVGDNGASAEGTPNGTFNEIISLNGAAAFETTEFVSQHIGWFGTPAAYNHYAVGCAHAPRSARTTPARTAASPATVRWEQLDIGDDSHDHLITPEQLMRVATAIQ